MVDGDINTTWSTEHYIAGSLGKPGLGISIDAAPGVAARTLWRSRRPAPASRRSACTPPPALPSSTPSGGEQSVTALGWTQLAPARTIGSHTEIPINSSRLLYRYYLVWLTKLPPGRETAQISEITLFK